ncbi:MAG: hypothetical protein ABH875_02355 [Candidatus Omnitrophota bacterium]
MKKILFFIFSSALLVICVTSTFAIPSFGTLMPERGRWQAGGRTDQIFKRDVRDYGDEKAGAYHYVISYGLSKWFSFDGMIGLGTVGAEFNDTGNLNYPSNFSGGYGWRAKLYRNDKHLIDWVWGFQHMSTHPDARRQVKGRKYEIIWDEWQLSTTVSKKISRLTPYCGMKYSFIYLINKVDGDRHRRLSHGSPIGLIVGADMRVSDYLYLNAEGRFFDETALNAGFTLRY